MSPKVMDELQQGQNLLRDEVNRLKIQMSLVIDILQALLGKEGNHAPSTTATLVTSLRLSGVIIDQRQPHTTNFLVQDSLLGCHPQPLLPRSPHLHPLPIPQQIKGIRFRTRSRLRSKLKLIQKESAQMLS